MTFSQFVKDVVSGEIFTDTSGTPADVEKFFRHGSFAKIRENAFVKWYVDGKNYFHAVSEALLAAKEEILIEDWWLSPELYLRRPPYKNEEYRLDRILKKKAEEGVKIYVVLFKEVTQALTLNSGHSKAVLEGLHKNILVQRHPDHNLDGSGTFFWAHHEKMIVIDRHTSFIGGLDLCLGRYDTGAHQLADFSHISKNHSIWPGQDYSNPRIKDFTEVQNWAAALISKKKTARMPWHDVSIGFVGKPALDVARHFIQRWNFIKKTKAENVPKYSVLVAKSDTQHERENPTTIKRYACTTREIEVHPESGTCCVQILRSSSAWSHGLQETEHSIQNAYLDTIKNAQHFIYIENQFFITATKESEDYAVKNLIGKAIVERVVRAHENNEKFRVIVAMPLLPAFPAELDTSEAGTVRLIMHFQYQSICRGGHSILEEIKKAGCADPQKYISFYALRKHDLIDHHAVNEGLGVLEEEHNTPKLFEEADSDPVSAESTFEVDPSCTFITEELYIHSKLLIADDRIVIVGSANLNDRSQNGNHDSEIAAIIEDKDYIPSRMAGERWEAGKFAATLRRAIFKEHLGLEFECDHEEVNHISYPPPIEAGYNPQELSEADKVVIDPASDDFYYNVWLHTANFNTEAFREVFHCIPDDSVTNWDEFKAFVPDHSKIPIGHVREEARNDMDDTRQKLARIKGHLVVFPLEFLKNKKLSGSVVIDAVTPMELFT